MQCHCNQRCTSDDHIDSDKQPIVQAEVPGRSNNDGRQTDVETAPTRSPIKADTRDHQNPGMCRAQKVVTRPIMPLTIKSQPMNRVAAELAMDGITIANSPNKTKEAPSKRKSVQ